MKTIYVEGADVLIRKLTSIESMNRVKGAIKQAAVELSKRMKVYPAHTSRPNLMLRGNSAKAKRMRAGFFAALKSGAIEVPYRRGQSPGSEKLGSKWTVSTQNAGWRAVVGNNASYARLVQDSANQTSYHRHTGWLTDNQAVKLYGPAAIRAIEVALLKEVAGG